MIAIAAIVASLTVAKQRHDARLPEEEKGPQPAPATSRLDLDQLRAAGM